MQEMPEAYIGEERPVTSPGVTSPMTGVIPRVVIVGAGFGGLQAARALGNVATNGAGSLSQQGPK
jgi:NADPH-dependent 2,4-dienoyl-CoA reductase/sulfur reductase-like enzyme